MTRRTSLYDEHVNAGAKMVPFAGWEMPLHYGSQIAEHNAVRLDSGMFDVSHMTVIDVGGSGATSYLRRLLANDVGRLDEPGKAAYGVMLNNGGGIIDDLITYRTDSGYRLVVNAATRDKVIDWLQKQNTEEVSLTEQDLAMVALQGPLALAKLVDVTGHANVADLEPFTARASGSWMMARTGYTGEDGVEVMLPGKDAVELWRSLASTGVAPIGLAARDTLRLEAGLNLYGQDMSEHATALVSNVDWTIHWQPEDREFVGRAALVAQRQDGVAEKLTGLVLEGRGVMRQGQRVVTQAGDGVVTSGVFSPTLGFSIALARVPRAARGECAVDVRGKMLAARVVKPPFVRHGERVFE
ncbi:MAG: glycine cleavage system aminomethyltransferase GcvT [Pseudomonadales bacterium]|jgi:aminomethyltransferase|nr:glycine cleavage system aminomethyltransferase GcvT [Pseudomonadales bacterium]MDP6469493.1 glycine cleavage system aminomethyltransferase GcvT [Pseudomonadales bacterium]MDP6827335.1 glycine cleavage system aminomethyltransferase GcvT [Pseudomonadales bacterium]MDP6971158.1 glycine cleavage system aminomethyltransferase GcvT [Pseudomonadales bacterium]|tara:strand:+ start:265 stop:1332 length:1068 start_codon:yes stop_codon:yes gene_type:complete